MAQDTPINQPTPEIARWHARWTKNRAFVDGEDAVKAAGELYLPKVRSDDSAAEYAAHKDRTRFYPAVTKIVQGLSGLIFRKRPQLNSTSARVQLLSLLITPDGQSLDDLAEWTVRETQITNFTGLLVDHPDASEFTGLSAANADRLGFRPRVAGYVGECVLEATAGIVNNARKLVRVRLLEDAGETVRELLLNEAGQYEVRVHQNTDAGFAFVRSSIPRINGVALTEIPFVLVSTSDKLCPQPSQIQHCVDLNLAHYRLSGTQASILHLTSSPIVTVVGFERAKDANGNEVQPVWDISPGAVWEIKDKDAKVDWFEFDPKGAEIVDANLNDIKDELSTIGHSILAPEKPAPEAAETQMIRRAAENAALAGFTRTVSRKIETALKMFARWADPANAEMAYALNLDFMPQALSSQEHAELRNDWLAGAITHETYLYCLRDGEVLPTTVDPTTEIDSTKTEALDRPSAVA
jgi:hypothetical protein